MKPPIAVMFDWCNTIVTETVNREAVARIMRDMNIGDVDISEIPLAPLAAEKYLQLCLRNRWQDFKTKYKNAFGSWLGTLLPNRNVHELLELLYKNNVRMGIVSNKRGTQLRDEVRSLGLTRYFSVILGKGDTVESKPSPEPIFVALESMGIAPGERVFFVGDSATDVVSARRANCYPIAFANDSIKGVMSFPNFENLGNFVAELLGQRLWNVT
ncbi:HAD family hydrolase [Anaplasma platys]|nr:HAD-IA family hydrolase [Anaplasma platys]